MKRIVLLNGPPYAGKDTIANALFQLDGMALRRFSQPIKDAVSEFFNLDTHELIEYEKRENKDAPQPRLCGRSYRQVQIDFGEWAKATYGADIFACLARDRIYESPSSTFVLPDCGFQVEVDALDRAFGSRNILMIHVTRPGCDYARDSRGFVRHRGKTIALHNDQTASGLQDIARAAVEEWLERE